MAGMAAVMGMRRAAMAGMAMPPMAMPTVPFCQSDPGREAERGQDSRRGEACAQAAPGQGRRPRNAEHRHPLREPAEDSARRIEAQAWGGIVASASRSALIVHGKACPTGPPAPGSAAGAERAAYCCPEDEPEGSCGETLPVVSSSSCRPFSSTIW